MRRLRRGVAAGRLRSVPSALALLFATVALAGCAMPLGEPRSAAMAVVQGDGDAVRAPAPHGRLRMRLLSAAEADALVARAIAAHEMLRP